MAIVGIESLHYGVEDVAACTRFFSDFGLSLIQGDPTVAHFLLPEGSSIFVRALGDPTLPSSSLAGSGVCKVVWGVDSRSSLDSLVRRLSALVEVRTDEEGVAHFVTPFGLAMALRVFTRKPVTTAPDPVNSPGRINRLNQHRKWRLRAHPKVISHVVYAVPDYLAAADFMRDALDFRLSDSQQGFGEYLRADGSNNHHSLLLLNATLPMPGMDGKVRFHHTNFGVEDIDEIMVGANHMTRCGWQPSTFGIGRHRIDSALFYYLPCPAGGEAEYGADADYVDETWVPRLWTEPLFGYAHFVHNLPPFLMQPPAWELSYVTGIPRAKGGH